jgi:geranylgeranyl diphosphate synthase, type I
MRMNLALETSRSPVRDVEPPRRTSVPSSEQDRREAVTRAVEELSQSLAAEPNGPFKQASQELASLVDRPGKRIRPYLCVLGYDSSAFPGAARPEGVATFAAALELLHVFLLVHDDVADRADSRRGGPSLHVRLRPSSTQVSEVERRHLGDQLAVVAGDWLYTRALHLMLEASGLAPERRTRALAHVLEICRSTAEGQYADLALSACDIGSVKVSDILEVYRLKTARYTFEGPLVAGAHLAGASDTTTEALARFSNHAGIAFQLQDDLLGLLASEERAGKPPLADLREGKKTWPLLTARSLLDCHDRSWLDGVLAGRNASAGDLSRVQALLRSTGALSQTLDEIDRHCSAASEALRTTTVSCFRRELVNLLDWIRSAAAQWR